MSSDFNTSLSGIKASDTIIELKASTIDGKDSTAASTADQCAGEANAKIEATEDVPPKEKVKPPPLDVSAAQEFQQQQAMGLEQEPLSSAPPIPGLMLDRRKGKERKIGHRRVNEEGEITFKKIQTSQIMGSIQLGISNAIGSLASKPERDLLIQDFAVVETTAFPKDGSNITPAHRYSDFKFKSYAPVAFRYFRDLFGIQPDDFLLSLCNYPMIELTNPGASGSIFYLTADDEFIIKTVQHKEAEFLQKLLAGYYMNLNQNPRTLLPKFYALYCYQCGGKNVRLVVMNNLLPSGIKLHEKYDLKGSTYKRKASKQEKKKKSPTYKDLDFMAHHPDGILLEAETYNALIKTIQRDCRVLNSFQIMDYSLLMGIHNLDVAKREKLEQHKKEEEANMSRVSDDSESASPDQVSGKADSKLTRSKSINRQRLAAFSTAMESIQAEVDVPEEDDDVPPGGIPAKNTKGEQLLLFLGIIDILQSFRLKKKLEHTLKSILHDGDTVSVHRPGFYASRFQDFMSKHVFKKIPSTGQHRKFKTMVTSVLALKQSPSKRKNPARKTSSDADTSKSLLSKIPSECENPLEDSSNVATIKHGEGDGKDFCKKEKQESLCTVTESKIVSQKFTTVVENTSISVDKSEVVSLSQVNIQTDSFGDCLSETSSPSMSGYGPAARSVMWTPPHSVEGSTPTHTEGTPSFTESSSSVDADSISHPMM